MTEPLIIPTEREGVVLRELATDDDDVAYNQSYNASRPEIERFDPESVNKHRTITDTRAARLSAGNKIRMGIWDSDTFVGSVNARPDEKGVEVGYWTDSRHVGCGYATLGARALSSYVASRFPLVHAEVIQGNDASAHILEKVGFKQISRDEDKINFELEAEIRPDPGIETQLDRAFANPLNLTLANELIVSPEETEERESYYKRRARQPENVPIIIYDRDPEMWEVYTDDKTQLPLLLAQAMRRLEIVKGEPDPGVEVTEELWRSALHEIAHGEMGDSIGIPSRYGVRVLYDPNENLWALGPYHFLRGPAYITRLEEAAVLAAPDDTSPGDLVSIRAAGYASRAEVLDRFYEFHPDLRPKS